MSKDVDVVVATEFKKKKIMMDLEWNQYDSLKDYKMGNIKTDGKDYLDTTEKKEINKDNGHDIEQVVVGQTDNNKDAERWNGQKTENEQIRLAVLESDLSDKDKVFMTMLLKDKNKEDAIMAILTSPLKDKQKVFLMQKIW